MCQASAHCIDPQSSRDAMLTTPSFSNARRCLAKYNISGCHKKYFIRLGVSSMSARMVKVN